MPAGSLPAGSQIVDSNSVVLRALVERDGGQILPHAILPDRAPVIRAALENAEAEVLLVSGGIFNHNLEFMNHFLEGVPSLLKDFLVGLVVGSVAALLLGLVKKLFNKKGQPA